MASPTPDAPAPDPKARDSTPEKEQKSEVNGHATPDEPKATPEPSTVNGNGKTDDRAVENGVSKDVEMEEGDDQNKSPAASSGKADENAGSEKKPESDSQPEQTTKPEPEAEQPAQEDVDMADAPAEDDSKDDKSAQDKPSDPPEKESKDVDMSEKPSDAAEKVNGTEDKAPTSSNDSALPTSEVDLQPASLSQLAIESNDAESAIPKPSVEVSMEDAPSGDASVTVKVSRERDDDATDEPAPKRAKTEPKSEEPAAPVPAPAPTTGSAAEQEESPLPGIISWNDPNFLSQILTPFQRREFRKVLGRVKKTKSGGHFKDSVAKLWPGLAESYLAKIEKPTDLSEIDRTLRDVNGPYVTVSDFQRDLALMYTNTRDFNGVMHDVTNAAFNAIRGIWEDVVHIPQEEPVKPKPQPKHKAPREPRVGAHADAAARKQSAGPGTSPAVEGTTPKPSPAVQETAVAATTEARRASNATEGDRPKRTVRAPKPKDIDYTTKPSRKKLKPELQFSEEVLSDLMHPKNKAINSWFMEAVDAEGLNIPHYYSIIKKPMDLGKVSRMLAGGDITSIKEFDKNVRLIFTNCYAFNGSVDQGNAVSYVASQLEDYYNNLMKGKDAWLAKHAKANAPPPASHGSEDEEEEDAEGEEAPAADGIDHAKEVRELEAKLREESGKLNELFEAETPNKSLIMVQEGILKMVQEALLQAKLNLSSLRQKQDKPAKKASKPSKPKASNSAARKPTGNAAHPKKSGGTKKAAAKKTLTAADKDLIASAINDLEYPHLDRAIDIIKRDTGQNENNDGELELDIDQLSNEALLKLWELCKKVLPGFGRAQNAAVSSPEAPRAPPPPPKQSKASTSAKPKKNKPMSAREQEERIAQLRGLRDLYRPGQDPADSQPVLQAPTPNAESSDESDSEEE
ncbi:bromodomain BDF1 [Fusarium albosuccineum]|uniref:Bromodomain BDF1 n=1 Tax=Fusarium albosuccineum TaxID=1237068 RepID=A0A8H4PD40_9HYPO|nr:bromodomain BDF1 [Fusarium albosuccineum]